MEVEQRKGEGREWEGKGGLNLQKSKEETIFMERRREEKSKY